MAFEELKERINLLPTEVEDLAKSNIEYYKLTAFKHIVRSVSCGVKTIIIGFAFLFLSFFLAIAGALALGELLGSYALGFVCIAGFFLLIILIILLLGRFIIDTPLLLKFSKLFFSEDKKDNETVTRHNDE